MNKIKTFLLYNTFWQHSPYFLPISILAIFCWEMSKFTWVIHLQKYIYKYIKVINIEVMLWAQCYKTFNVCKLRMFVASLSSLI
jgi:hypothetical protein